VLGPHTTTSTGYKARRRGARTMFDSCRRLVALERLSHACQRAVIHTAQTQLFVPAPRSSSVVRSKNWGGPTELAEGQMACLHEAIVAAIVAAIASCKHRARMGVCGHFQIDEMKRLASCLADLLYLCSHLWNVL